MAGKEGSDKERVPFNDRLIGMKEIEKNLSLSPCAEAESF